MKRRKSRVDVNRVRRHLHLRPRQDVRRHRRARRPRPRGPHGRGARLPRSQRLRQVDHDPRAARTPARRRRRRAPARRRPVARHRRAAPAAGLRAGRRHAVAEPLGRRGDRPARPPPRRASIRRAAPSCSSASSSTRRRRGARTPRATGRRSRWWLRWVLTELGGRKGIVDAYLATALGVTGLIASAYAVQVVLRLRAEETGGAPSLLATPSPGRVGGRARRDRDRRHAVLSVAGAAAGLRTRHRRHAAAAALGRARAAPAAWVIAGVALALFGLAPRSRPPPGARSRLPRAGELGPCSISATCIGISPFAHVPKLRGAAPPRRCSRWRRSPRGSPPASPACAAATCLRTPSRGRSPVVLRDDGRSSGRTSTDRLPGRRRAAFRPVAWPHSASDPLQETPHGLRRTDHHQPRQRRDDHLHRVRRRHRRRLPRVRPHAHPRRPRPRRPRAPRAGGALRGRLGHDGVPPRPQEDRRRPGRDRRRARRQGATASRTAATRTRRSRSRSTPR